MPFQLNTISVTSAPPISTAKSMATTVTTGMSALRSACTNRTRRGDRPLARASRM